MEVKFSIPGVPQSKRRMSVTRSGIMYTPKKIKDAEADFISLAYQYVPFDPPFEDSVSLEIRYFFSIPKSYPKWKKEIMRSENWHHISRPDLDNIMKMTMDCMTKLGFWRDDSFVYSVFASKYYSDRPRTEVTVTYYPAKKRKQSIK